MKKECEGNILIVEDEWVIRTALADFFRKKGCEVIEARSGEEAVAQLSGLQTFPDVVITDINLGGELDGWDIAEKAREIEPCVGIIYVTGNFATPKRVVENSSFFEKPYHPEEIFTACAFTRTAQ